MKLPVPSHSSRKSLNPSIRSVSFPIKSATWKNESNLNYFITKKYFNLLYLSLIFLQLSFSILQSVIRPITNKTEFDCKFLSFYHFMPNLPRSETKKFFINNTTRKNCWLNKNSTSNKFQWTCDNHIEPRPMAIN